MHTCFQSLIRNILDTGIFQSTNNSLITNGLQELQQNPSGNYDDKILKRRGNHKVPMLMNGTAYAVSDFEPGQRNLSMLHRPLQEINGVQIFIFHLRNISFLGYP